MMSFMACRSTPWTFHEQRCLWIFQRLCGTAARSAVSQGLGSHMYPPNLLHFPSTLSLTKSASKAGMGWICAFRTFIFWTRHSSNHFSRDASLITPGTRRILAENGQFPQSHSCRWCTPACSYPFPSLEKAWHGYLSHMLQSLPLAK